MHHRAWAALLAAVFLPGAPESGFADTATLVPAADTVLWEFDSGSNFGANTDLPAGTIGPLAGTKRSRGLLRFDVAGVLPAGAQIQFAVLSLQVTRVPDGFVDTQFRLHRMLKPWTEGVQRGGRPGGAPAAPGECTWDHRVHPDIPWSTPGGGVDIDYSAVPATSETVRGLGLYEFELGSRGVSELQDWLDRPETNFGWMLRVQDESLSKTARRFAAREDPDRSPSLRIEFTRPLRVDRIVRDGDQLRITFFGRAGRQYAVQERPLDPSDSWATILTTRTVDSDGDLTVTTPLRAGTSGFLFRLQQFSF